MDFYNIYRVPRRTEEPVKKEPEVSYFTQIKTKTYEIIMKPINLFIINPINYYTSKGKYQNC